MVPEPTLPAKTAYALVADELRRRIVTGELAPDSRLPPDAELRETFNVGQSTIREAVRILASEHLVRSVRGVNGGTFVTMPTVRHMGGQLEVGVTLMASSDRLSIQQLMEVRHMTEVPAAGYAASRYTDADLESLKSMIFDPASAPQESTFEKNSGFHLQIVRAAHNPLLELLARPLFSVLGNRVGRQGATMHRWQEVDKDHREILEAITARDAMAAMELTRKHLDSLSEFYLELDRRNASDTS